MKELQLISNKIKSLMCKKGISLFVMVLTFLNQACQETRESGDNLLQAEILMSEHPDSSMWILENAVTPDKLSKGQHAEWCLLVTQARDKNYIRHTSDSLINIASDYYSKHNYPDRQRLAYYYMGRVNHDLNRVTKAQEYYLKALEIAKISGDYALTGRIHGNLGELYTIQNALDIAMFHLKEAVVCFRNIDEPRNMSFVLRDIARIYTLQNKPDSAIINYRQALLYSDSQSRFSVLSELGFIYMEKQEYREAYYFIRESLKNIYDSIDYYPVYLTLGKLFYKIGEADSARYYLLKSMNSLRLETKAGSYFFLYNIAKEKRQWEEYARYQTQYEALRDSVMSQRYTAETQKLQHQYDYKEAENIANKAKLNHIIAVRNNIILALIILVLAGCLTGYYTYILAEKKRMQKMQEELFQYFSIKQNKEYPEQMKLNVQRISELESKLDGRNAEDKEVILLEKKLLELENNQMYRILAEKAERKKKLDSSDIYNLFIREPNQKIADNDKEALMSLIDETFPAFKSHILDLSPNISAEDLFMCYLIKANVKGTRISQIMCLSKQAISMRRKRLAMAMLGEQSSLKSLDSLISSS
jgi:tetratricopeptide (TPR) repeat protein